MPKEKNEELENRESSNDEVLYETKNNLTEWNIGGKSYAGELIDYLKVQIDKLELPF